MDIMDKMDGMNGWAKPLLAVDEAGACPMHECRVKDPTYYPEHQKLGKFGMGVGTEHEHEQEHEHD